jgi:hypothetical protein
MPDPDAPPSARDDSDVVLRRAVRSRLERRRELLGAAVAYAISTAVLVVVWAVTEYGNSGGWPQRIDDDGQPGAWNPWIVYPLLGGAALLAGRAVLLHVRRPVDEDEVEREMRRPRAER